MTGIAQSHWDVPIDNGFPRLLAALSKVFCAEKVAGTRGAAQNENFETTLMTERVL